MPQIKCKNCWANHVPGNVPHPACDCQCHKAENAVAHFEKEVFPCPHGREPIGGEDGWRHCPHCLGINQLSPFNDLKPFVHGEEGSHGVCKEVLERDGGKAMCCACTGHKCKESFGEEVEINDVVKTLPRGEVITTTEGTSLAPKNDGEKMVGEHDGYCSHGKPKEECNLTHTYHLTQPPAKDWEKRFDERFGEGCFGFSVGEEHLGEVRAFISLEMQAAEDAIRKLYEEKESKNYAGGYADGAKIHHDIYEIARREAFAEIEKFVKEAITEEPLDQTGAGSNYALRAILSFIKENKTK